MNDIHLPCPNCGGEAVATVDRDGIVESIRCETCEQKAISAWRKIYDRADARKEAFAKPRRPDWWQPVGIDWSIEGQTKCD